MTIPFRHVFPIVRKSARKGYRARLRVLGDEPMAPHKREYSRRVYLHREPIPLLAGTTGKAVAYACGGCGSVHSAKMHGLAHAKDAARRCCLWRDRCNVCGCEVAHQQYTCQPCRDRRSWENDQKRARKACVVEDDGEPVWSQWGDGEWGDGYSSSVEAMLDAWSDDHAPEQEYIGPGDDGMGRWRQKDPDAVTPPPPPFVYCTSPVRVELDQQWIDESLTDNLHEDAEACDLRGHDALCDAVEAFNAAQSGRAASYQIDYSRIIVIDRERYLAYLDEAWDGTPDILWRSSADPARIPVYSEHRHPAWIAAEAAGSGAR